MKKPGKRGQAAEIITNPASQAGMIILVITIAIVLYILMLPPDDRADLLGENLTGGDNDKETFYNFTTKFVKNPGKLSYLSFDEVELDVSPVFLHTTVEPVDVLDINSIYIKRSLFNKEFKNISFSIDEPTNTDNFLMSFSAVKSSGRLSIELNGRPLFERELVNGNPDPISIPKEYLEEVNVLSFEVSGPGAMFWKSNEYLLENVQISGDQKDDSAQESLQNIFVDKEYKDNLDYAEFSMVVDCNLLEVKPLEIYLNTKQIFNGVPDCGAKTITPKIAPEKILEGQNSLRFKAEDSAYNIYSAQIELFMQEQIYPTYYFDISSKEYANLQDGYAIANLTFIFTNDDEYKKGELIVNGMTSGIDTREYEYTKEIGKYIREGSNSLEIRPKGNGLDITELTLVYAE